jgi:hypothetical protein
LKGLKELKELKGLKGLNGLKELNRFYDTLLKLFQLFQLLKLLKSFNKTSYLYLKNRPWQMHDLSQILTPEERLLLSLCRLQFTGEQKRTIGDLIGQTEDWDKFVTLANEHGLIALCWYNIDETGNSEKIPEKILERLHKGYLTSLARNTQIFELLNNVLRIAEKENIDVLLIKGLALEKTVYGNRGLRQMNDLDILVRNCDAIRLRKALLKNGFESQPMISTLHEKVLPAYGKHLPEMYKEGLSIEIHFKLFEQKGDSLTLQFFSSSELCALSPEHFISCRTPSAANHFLYLVKHLRKHESVGTSQLRLYTDLAVLLSQQREEILRKDLFDYAMEAGLEEELSEKLFLLKDFWGINLTPVDLKVPDPVEKETVIEKFIHFLRHPKDTKLDDNPESLLKPMKELEGFYNKTLFIIGYLIPTIPFMKYRYKAQSTLKVILFYPIRWAKLLKLVITRTL